jgi:hypothetical protein
MIISAKMNSRGLREIRTHSGRVNRVGIPYMAYMNISCLEMEKARREKEKLSALTRIRDIEKRLQEIESEKDALLKKLGERQANALERAAKVKCGLAPNNSGFKIRY